MESSKLWPQYFQFISVDSSYVSLNLWKGTKKPKLQSNVHCLKNIIHEFYVVTFSFDRLYANRKYLEEDDILNDNAEKAKDFQAVSQRIDTLNQDYCKVKKICTGNQLIETVIERLPTMVLMITILFAYFDCDRLGHLIGLSFQNKYYNAILVFTFVSGLVGLISPLIHLRCVELLWKSVILIWMQTY